MAQDYPEAKETRSNSIYIYIMIELTTTALFVLTTLYGGSPVGVTVDAFSLLPGTFHIYSVP